MNKLETGVLYCVLVEKAGCDPYLAHNCLWNAVEERFMTVKGKTICIGEDAKGWAHQREVDKFLQKHTDFFIR